MHDGIPRWAKIRSHSQADPRLKVNAIMRTHGLCYADAVNLIADGCAGVPPRRPGLAASMTATNQHDTATVG